MLPTGTPSQTERSPGRPRQGTSDGGVRERLLDAATRLVTERGSDAVGIREIAAEAGVTPGMIAYYFGGKAGLHEAMFDRVYELLVANMRAIASASHEGDGDPLARLVELQIATLTTAPWIPRMLVREVLARDDGPLRAFFARRFAEGPAQLVPELLRREMGEGRIRDDLDPQLMVLSLIGMMVFPFLAAPVLGETLGYELDEAFRDRFSAHTQRLLLRGIAPSEDAP